ncbi:MAG: DNA-binding protein WhiA [Clostridia bacterium]|nr:DNA-binding protein WhiA [Clostridia bacterium]
MSYSSDTKEELCRLEPESVCCLLAELSGIVSAAGSVIYRGGGRKRLSIETENTAVARRAFKLLRDVFDVQPELVTLRRARLGGRSAHRIEVEGDEASFVLEGCGIAVAQRRGVPREITVRKCCRMAFLRGVFLASGSVTDPEKEYHLEYVLGDEAFATALQRLIARFDLAASQTKRRQMSLVYLKGQSEITDMLSIIGAQSARFAMEDAFIRKELRNNANRATNCDSANMERAVVAASRQTQAIARLIAAVGESSLPPALLQTAKLRMQYPEVSLEELGRLCDPPVGKSGVNHRLRKLEKMAAELEQTQKEETVHQQD